MTRDTIFLSAIVIAGILAILNAWSGAVLLRSGDQTGGCKHMVLGFTMIMMMAVAAFIRDS